jgi:hypothetical protein
MVVEKVRCQRYIEANVADGLGECWAESRLAEQSLALPLHAPSSRQQSFKTFAHQLVLVNRMELVDLLPSLDIITQIRKMRIFQEHLSC